MIFVDTSAWLAIADVTDGCHRSAEQARGEIVAGKRGQLLTSDYVLDETYTLVRNRVGREALELLARSMEASPNVHVQWVGPRVFKEALDLMRSHGDKRWSLTDCTSFVLMRELDVRDAFTFDRNFAEAGFTMVPARA